MQPVQPGPSASKSSDVTLILIIVGVLFVLLGGGALVVFGAGAASYTLTRSKGTPSAVTTPPTGSSTAPAP
jgi:hypothetical protein